MARKSNNNTFEIFGREKHRAEVVVLNERADLRGDRGAIKAHHKELAHLSGECVLAGGKQAPFPKGK